MTRYFGVVRANVDSIAKRIRLDYGPRRGSEAIQLSDPERERCVSWALTSLGDLLEDGYIVDASGVGVNLGIHE